MSSGTARGTEASAPGFGLAKNRLSGLETLAQSVSSVSPTAGPTVLIPLVFALAGNGTWLSFLLATAAVLSVALNVSLFASYSASPGSLYAYAISVLDGPIGELSAWGLLIAYIGTASAVTGGFVGYANVLLESMSGLLVPPLVLAAASIAFAIWISYRDVKISARFMLWCEAISVGLILFVIVVTLSRTGLHVDRDQFALRGATWSGVRLGLVLGIFSFVGFESATTLGEEAINPLRTVPRAVVSSALFAGLFFVFCAYSETLAFREAHRDLGQTTAPLHVLAERVHFSGVGPLIDLCAALSFLACSISCITAAGRVVLFMAHRNLLHFRFSRVHQTNRTPGVAIIAVGLASALGPIVLFLRGTTGFDVNGWMGSFATYGFIIAYLLVSIATPLHLKKEGHLSLRSLAIASIAVVSMAAAFMGSLYPLPPAPYPLLAGLFFLYMAAGFLWSVRVHRLSGRSSSA